MLYWKKTSIKNWWVGTDQPERLVRTKNIRYSLDEFFPSVVEPSTNLDKVGFALKVNFKNFPGHYETFLKVKS